YQVKSAYQNPKPVQKPHPPLIFGGESDAALRRVATLGDGWFGFNLTPDSLEARLTVLQGLLEKQGRTLQDIKLYVGPDQSARSQADMQRFESLGVEQVILPVMAAKIERLEERADKALALALG
ncbi:MAG: LLM class flavin-dependent oxidoreductase, partial [Pseudomonadales bacterium]